MAEKVIKRRNVDKDIAAARSALATAGRRKLSAEQRAVLKARLEDAVIEAAARRVAERLPQVSPEAKARIAALLGGAL